MAYADDDDFDWGSRECIPSEDSACAEPCDVYNTFATCPSHVSRTQTIETKLTRQAELILFAAFHRRGPAIPTVGAMGRLMDVCCYTSHVCRARRP